MQVLPQLGLQIYEKYKTSPREHVVAAHDPENHDNVPIAVIVS